MKSSVWARPRTSGPTRIPSISSTTTTGGAKRRGNDRHRDRRQRRDDDDREEGAGVDFDHGRPDPTAGPPESRYLLTNEARFTYRPRTPHRHWLSAAAGVVRKVALPRRTGAAPGIRERRPQPGGIHGRDRQSLLADDPGHPMGLPGDGRSREGEARRRNRHRPDQEGRRRHRGARGPRCRDDAWPAGRGDR